MKIAVPTVAIALVCARGALGEDGEPHPFYKNHPYISPESFLIRAPCPAINTLANHGFIGRNGKNVTRSDMVSGMEQVFHLGPDFVNSLVSDTKAMGIKSFRTHPETGEDMFDLFDLNEHNVIEHDSSFVRQDEYFQPNAQFDEELFQALESHAITLPVTAPGHSSEVAATRSGEELVITRQGLAQHRTNRIHHSRMHNPEVSYDHNNEKPTPTRLVLMVESYFVFLMDDDPNLEKVSMAHLRSFLQDNRIPDTFVPRSVSGQPLFNPPEDGNFTSVMEFFGPTVEAAITGDLPSEEAGEFDSESVDQGEESGASPPDEDSPPSAALSIAYSFVEALIATILSFTL